MPDYIVKIDLPEGPRYLLWSSIVDAPVTFGMSLDEFREFYQAENGRSSMLGLEDRLVRVENRGTSAHHYASGRELMKHNRAGKDETCMTYEQIVEVYCVRRSEGGKNKPAGLCTCDWNTSDNDD